MPAAAKPRPWTAPLPKSTAPVLARSRPTAFAQALNSKGGPVKPGGGTPYMSVAEALKELSDNQAKAKAAVAMRNITSAAPPDWQTLQRREESQRTRWLAKQHDQQRKKWGRLAPAPPDELSRPSSSSSTSTGRGLPTFGLAACEKGIWRREGAWGAKGRDGIGWAWNGIEYYDRRALDRPKGPAPAWMASNNSIMPLLEPLKLKKKEIDAALWAVFRAADADGSGNISKRELYRAIEQAGIEMTHSEKIALYKAGDADESGSMEWGEFQRAGRKYAGQLVDGALWRVFRAADADGSGEISEEELYGALDAAGIEMTQDEKADWYRAADQDGSGAIEYAEFRLAGCKYADQLVSLTMRSF